MRTIISTSGGLKDHIQHITHAKQLAEYLHVVSTPKAPYPTPQTNQVFIPLLPEVAMTLELTEIKFYTQALPVLEITAEIIG